MKNAIAMHVIYGLEQLKDVKLHFLWVQVVLTPLNMLIKIAVHEFKYKGKSSGWFIAFNNLNALLFNNKRKIE